ncbi:MAG: hypothetical protein QGG84_00930, partial [Rhodospirillales bacterium]|nr:hypothetical protein [Rhodospirillales bacterium]
HELDEFSLEYKIFVPRMGSGNHLKISVEPVSGMMTAGQLDNARQKLIEAIRTHIKVTPDVEVVEIGSLPRFEGKGKRLIREE